MGGGGPAAGGGAHLCAKRSWCSANSTLENWNAAMAEHEQMMQALADRDGQALSRIMGEHIRNTWPRIKDVVS